MSRKSDAEVIREVCEWIDRVIEKNRKRENLIIFALFLLIVSGLGLIIYGAAMKSWQLLAPGGFLGISVVLPVRRLIKLREDNLRLQMIPQLLRLAETQEAKVLAAKLIQRLIEQV